MKRKYSILLLLFIPLCLKAERITAEKVSVDLVGKIQWSYSVDKNMETTTYWSNVGKDFFQLTKDSLLELSAKQASPNSPELLREWYHMFIQRNIDRTVRNNIKFADTTSLDIGGIAGYEITYTNTASGKEIGVSYLIWIEGEMYSIRYLGIDSLNQETKEALFQSIEINLDSEVNQEISGGEIMGPMEIAAAYGRIMWRGLALVFSIIIIGLIAARFYAKKREKQWK